MQKSKYYTFNVLSSSPMEGITSKEDKVMFPESEI